MSSFVDPDALVSSEADVGAGTKVWGLSHIREGVTVGQGCIIGRGVYVDSSVQIGDYCKIQNSALIYGPAILGNGVFVGPGVVFTNDRFPRAVDANFGIKSDLDWDPVGVVVHEGASIGAGSVCVAPITIGAWAMVAAGSVVTKDVAPFSLVRGVPAKHVGWVGRSGVPLMQEGPRFKCPASEDIYEEVSGRLQLKDS